MQFKRLTPLEKAIRNWRTRRDRLVGRLMAKDRSLLSYEALEQAEKQMPPFPTKSNLHKKK